MFSKLLATAWLLNRAGTCVLLFISLTAHTQGSVRGQVLDLNGSPMADANVLLLNVKDSSLVKGSISAQNGWYAFEKIESGHYLISSTHVGFRQVYTPAFQVGDKTHMDMKAIQLSERETELKKVTVNAKKPLFEQKIDRMVINVASSVTNAGSTALDVLMRSPGVLVDRQNETISLSGKDGVVVMINGKISRIPIASVMKFLAGMPASNIEKIELITTPPANFDAEGNAGYINIVLKENTQYGTNGSFSVTAGYGRGWVTQASTNFNHRGKRYNLFGDYSFDHTEVHQSMWFYRQVLNGNITLENISEAERDAGEPQHNHNGRLGIDVEVSKKTTVGALLSGFSHLFAMSNALNQGQIFKNGVLDTTVIIDNSEKHPLHNWAANVNLMHHFNDNTQLLLNLDYLWYKDANTVDYLNHYYDGAGAFLYQNKTKSSKTTPIEFWVGSADYSKKLSQKIDLEAGVKATVSHFQNDVWVKRAIQDEWKLDPAFTANYNLRENISAAYGSLSIKLSEKTSSKAGLRYEYTNSNLSSATQKDIVDRHYGRFFPSIFLSHTINEKNAVNLSYSRRITRPTFNNMAPFVYFVDPNTYFSGNPALQPSIANIYKGDYLFKRLIFSLAYTHELHTITNFAPKVNPQTNTQTLAAENQKSKNVVAATFSLPAKINSWWSMQNNITAIWQQLNAIYDKAPLRITQKNVNVNTTQTFTLPKDFTVELTGYYQTGGLFGIYKIKPFLIADFGVQKKLGAKSGNLRFAISEFTGAPKFKPSVNAPEKNLVVRGRLQFDNTTFRLTYSHRFGSDKIQERKARKTAAEEEQQRVQQN